MSDHRAETIALHAGQAPDPTIGARAVPGDQATPDAFSAADLDPTLTAARAAVTA